MQKKKNIIAAILVGAIVVVGCIAGAWYYTGHGTQTILVYSGAGLKCAMDELGGEFENETGVNVEIIYGGSGHLFGQLSISKRGDIFIPGADYYTKRGIEEGLLCGDLTRNVTYHIPMILVQEGNPENITSLEDMARPGIKVALGDVKECAIGILSKKMLEKQGLYEEIKANNLEVTTATVNELLTYVAIGTVDAAIVWEDNVGTLVEQGEVDVVEIEPSKNIIETIPISVTRCTNNPELAKEFTDFVCSKKGRGIWEENGFKPYAG
ncbi:MAG: molybdate ABC transporter substrate-binding protein [Halobacteriota archaeon]